MLVLESTTYFRTKIKEAFNNWVYSPSEDKKELMMDFYLLSTLPMPDDKDLATALQDSRDSLYKFLRTHMLHAVMFAICAEFRHLFDANNGDKIIKFFEKRNKAWFIKKYAQYYKAVQAVGDEFMDVVPKLRPEITRDDHRGYVDSYKAVKASGIDNVSFIELAKESFLGLSWSAQYGGKNWAGICDGWLNLYHAKNEGDVVVRIDQVYSLQHNTDVVFNKVRGYYKADSGYGWIKKALDLKFNVKDTYELFDHVSPDVKNFAAAVIKNVKGTSLEGWLKGKEEPKKEIRKEKKVEKSHKFRVGDVVRITSVVPKDKNVYPTWVPDMDFFLGKAGVVIKVEHKPGGTSYRVKVNGTDTGYLFNSRWLEYINVKKDSKAEGKFKVGDKVKIADKKPRGDIYWTSGMDKYAGETGKVVGRSYLAVQVKLDKNGSVFTYKPVSLTKINDEEEKESKVTFKVGDKVKIISDLAPEIKGEEGEVEAVIGQTSGKQEVQVKLPHGTNHWFTPSDLELVSSASSNFHFKPGDEVEVIANGKSFPGWKRQANKMGATNFVVDSGPRNGMKGTVVNAAKHPYTPTIYPEIVLVKGEDGKEFLIGWDGLKLVKSKDNAEKNKGNDGPITAEGL